MTPGQLKSGLAPIDKELEMLFQPMLDEHLEQSRVNEPVPSATEINAQVVPPGTSLSITIAQDTPSTSASSSTSDIHHLVQHQEIVEDPFTKTPQSFTMFFILHITLLLKIQNTMAEQNIPTQPPTRTDEQIVNLGINGYVYSTLITQQESIHQEEGDDPDLELAKKISLEAHQEKEEGEGDDADAPIGGVTIRDPVSETTPKLPEVVGKGKAIVTEEQVAHSLIDLSKKKRTTDQFILESTSSTSDQKQTERETEAAALKLTNNKCNPCNKLTGSNSGKLRVSLAGQNPEHMDDEFLATASPKVQ
ncbi:hypothetical protein Tco_0834374 [Tanacetum coccineum]